MNVSMSQPASDLPVPPDISPERTLTAAQWGMASFLLSEVAFFGTLIAAYVAFMGSDVVGPTPREALSMPLVILATICLLSSSIVNHLAEQALERGQQSTFRRLLAVTIALGIAFLVGTALEWRELINEHHLTINRNLFGTTFYTLVGFHGLHVAVGVVVMLTFLAISFGRELCDQDRAGAQMIAWYWHFVDAVWIVVFLVVYVASRSGAA
jgi:cytochrome c oxidase subunit 3/cytochrome o ubiquinol oxidase subunit 3